MIRFERRGNRIVRVGGEIFGWYVEIYRRTNDFMGCRISGQFCCSLRSWLR